MSFFLTPPAPSAQFVAKDQSVVANSAQTQSNQPPYPTHSLSAWLPAPVSPRSGTTGGATPRRSPPAVSPPQASTAERQSPPAYGQSEPPPPADRSPAESPPTAPPPPASPASYSIPHGSLPQPHASQSPTAERTAQPEGRPATLPTPQDPYCRPARAQAAH